MKLNKHCSCCKLELTTKNTQSIGRNEIGLWLNCRDCGSTALFLEKTQQRTVDSATRAIFGSAFDLSDLKHINGDK